MQLLKLRYFQLKRDLSYWVLLIAVAAFYIAKSVSEVSFFYCLALATSCVFMLSAYHLNRKDLHFINTYFAQPKKELLLNYSLLFLPVSVAMFINHYWLIAFGMHVCILLVVFLNLQLSSPKLGFITKLVPSAQFEWISGLRKNFYLLLPLILLAVFLSPVKFFDTVALFILNSIFVGFYAFFEPLVMLNPENLSSENFLKNKIIFSNKVLLFSSGPLLLVNSIFHPDIAWFNICFLAGFLFINSCSVYIKYANYKPNDEIRFHIDYLLLFASALIPFLLPISYMLTQSHKKKAIETLSYYFDDHN